MDKEIRKLKCRCCKWYDNFEGCEGIDCIDCEDSFEIEYSKRPPYEVLKTKWVSFDDVLKLKEVADEEDMSVTDLLNLINFAEL